MSDQQNNENEEAKSCCCEGLWWQDRLDAAGWGLFFIWGALVLLADITNLADKFDWWNGWGIFFIGMGIIILIGTVIRWLVPQYRSKWAASLILGLLILAFGFGISGWKGILDWIWVVILAAIGISIFIRAFARRR